MISHKNLIAAAASLAVLASPAFAADAVPANVKAVVNDLGRTPWDLLRDPMRKPGEILAFSQIKRGAVAVDLVPGEGYYTRMLAKLVGPKGTVYAYVPQGALGGARDGRVDQREGKAPALTPPDAGDACSIGCYGGDVQLHGIVPGSQPPHPLEVDYVLAIQNIAEYSNMTVLWEGINGFGIPKQADYVFTIDGYHKLHYPPPARGNNPPRPVDLVAANKAIFRAMNNGAVYVIADYTAAPGTGFSGAASLNRVEEDAVKQEVLAAGFVLDGESKILANASDDHKSKVDGTYEARDKADQFVLRFKKPMNALNTNKRPNKAQEFAQMKNYYNNTEIFRVGLKGIGENGERLRYNYYSPDHTYQEFGRIGEGPGPMQAGTWWWDADGHNCQLHQFPLDERGNVVCHDDVLAHPVGKVEDRYLGKKPEKVDVELVPGHIHIY